jgi:biotin carboxyl carrier protein
MKEYKYTINGNKYEVVISDITENIATLTVNGEQYTVEMEKQAEPEKPKPVVRKAAETAESSEGGSSSAAASSAGTAIKAPLPGVITDIPVEVGQEVQAGETVIVLEAMKMANALQAEKAGKVSAIVVKVGQSVMEDEPLVYIE